MIKIKPKKIIALLCTASLVTMFSSCDVIDENKNNLSDNNISSLNSNQIQNQKDNSDYTECIKCINSLTGLEISQNKVNLRPTAVMINNIKIAQPLLGISKADIIYECLVEGGITRLMAVYKDLSNVECIGSIRSVRPNYLSLTRGLDATILYHGTSTQAKNIIKSDGNV